MNNQPTKTPQSGRDSVPRHPEKALFQFLKCYPCFLNWQEAAALALCRLARFCQSKARGVFHNIYRGLSLPLLTQERGAQKRAPDHEARGKE